MGGRATASTTTAAGDGASVITAVGGTTAAGAGVAAGRIAAGVTTAVTPVGLIAAAGTAIGPPDLPAAKADAVNSTAWPDNISKGSPGPAPGLPLLW
jgi:hypothetical protein